MATNSLGGINLAQISERSLSFLKPSLPALNLFSTDFSDSIAQKGESVTTRVATAATAVDVSGGFTAATATSSAKTVTLNQELGYAVAFKSGEIAKGGMDLLNRVFFPVVTQCIVRGAIDYVLGLATAGAVTVSTVIASGNSLDSDKFIDLGTALDNLDVPAMGRFALLKPSYYNGLAKDQSIKDASASGSTDALIEMLVKRIEGFTVAKYSQLPACSRNMVGLIGGKEGLIVAARMPALPEGAVMVDAVNVVDPETKFPYQIQYFYVPTERNWYLAGASLFGASIGVGENLEAITSA